MYFLFSFIDIFFLRKPETTSSVVISMYFSLKSKLQKQCKSIFGVFFRFYHSAVEFLNMVGQKID